MHDNQQANPATNAQSPQATTFALDHHHVVALTGRDAAAFAQAQFMNDVNAITPGHWQWNGWLTPKGRVVALFALLRIDAETVWLLLTDAEPGAIVAALQRFVFRSKVTISAPADLHVTATFSAPDAARDARLGTSTAGEAELDMGGEGGPRSLRIGVDPAVEDTALRARWAAADLEHGLPRLPASQAEQWTPQQLSLERLGGFSVRKGCYPGQEIVARTHFLGKAKRGLVLLEADAPLLAGAEVGDGEAVLGTVISAASVEQRHLALAVLPNERTAALTAGGVPVREIPVIGGLAR